MVTTQEIRCNTYIASHIVGHDAPELHRVNEVLYPLEDPFLHKEYLGEGEQDFQTL